MSLGRYVYYCAVIGGWCALAAWVLTELLWRSPDSIGGVGMVAAVLGAFIAAGLSAVTAYAEGDVRRWPLAVGIGLLGGAVCGFVGGAVGQLLVQISEPLRPVGWAIMGTMIGVVLGLTERARTRIRNGIIGGLLGGLIGGILFDYRSSLITFGTDFSGRATGFVILGLCVGALIGLAQVVLREAWLTVVDGYRAGRQLILAGDGIRLGRSDHLKMSFGGPNNTQLEPEHVGLSRESGGTWLVEDLNTKVGTSLNGQRLQQKTRLQDGDVIKFGVNYVRFNVRQRRGAPSAAPAAAPASPAVLSAPPPPPVSAPRPLAPPPRGTGTQALSGANSISPPHPVPTPLPAHHGTEAGFSSRSAGGPPTMPRSPPPPPPVIRPAAAASPTPPVPPGRTPPPPPPPIAPKSPLTFPAAASASPSGPPAGGSAMRSPPPPPPAPLGPASSRVGSAVSAPPPPPPVPPAQGVTSTAGGSGPKSPPAPMSPAPIPDNPSESSAGKHSGATPVHKAPQMPPPPPPPPPPPHRP